MVKNNMLRHFPITLIEKKVIAQNTFELTFAVPSSSFSFRAGQYVSIEIPSLIDAAIPDRYHDFSIVSSPMKPNEISIAFRGSESIFKIAILSLPVGGMVNMDGPKGVLTLPEASDVPLVFIAGGIGITPLLSMARYATETSSPQKITLLYCNGKKETAAYLEELKYLEKNNKNFTFKEYLGVSTKELFAPHVQEKQHAIWYIVGMSAMVENVYQILVDSGILDSQIRVEEFPGYVQQ